MKKSLLVVVEATAGPSRKTARQIRQAIQAELRGRLAVVTLQPASPPRELEARIAWAETTAKENAAFALAYVRIEPARAWILVVHVPARRAIVRILEKEAVGNALVEAIAVFVSDALEALAEGGGIEIVRPRSATRAKRSRRERHPRSRRPGRPALELHGGLEVAYEASHPARVAPQGRVGIALMAWKRLLFGVDLRLGPEQRVEDDRVAIAVSQYPLGLHVAWRFQFGSWIVQPGLAATIRLERVYPTAKGPNIRIEDPSWHVSLGTGAELAGCRRLGRRLALCANAEGGWLFYRPTYGIQTGNGFEGLLTQGSWYVLAGLSLMVDLWP